MDKVSLWRVQGNTRLRPMRGALAPWRTDHGKTGNPWPLQRRLLSTTAAEGQQGLSGGVFDHLQEIEVVGSALSKSGAIVEVTARGGGTEVIRAQIDPLLAGNAAELGQLLTQAAQDAYDQMQYEVKRKFVEVSMSARRQQQLKEREKMNLDLTSFKEV